MSAQMKHGLAALLAAAAIAVPSVSEAKPGKDRGSQGENSGKGGGGEKADDRGPGRGQRHDAGNNHQIAEATFARPAKIERAAAFSPDRDRGGKHGRERQQRSAPRNVFASAGDSQSPGPEKSERRKGKSREQRMARRGNETRIERFTDNRVSRMSESRRDKAFASYEKSQKQAMKRQRFTDRAEARPQQHKSQRRDQRVQQAFYAAPATAFQRMRSMQAYAPRFVDTMHYDGRQTVGVAPAPVYLAPLAFAPARFTGASSDGDGGFYPANYGALPAGSPYSEYAPYEAGYDDGGLGGLSGLFGGGGGGFGDILVALLPLLLGDELGLGGLTGGGLGSGLLGDAAPQLSSAYGLNDFSAAPAYSQEATAFEQYPESAGQGLPGGDSLISLLPLVLESGLLGGGDLLGGAGGLGDVLGTGGLFGQGDALGLAGGDNGYPTYDPFAGPLTSAFGV